MEEYNLKEPLIDHPWKNEAIRIIQFSKDKSEDFRAFIFDICMSLAYIDSTSGIEKHIEFCESCPGQYNDIQTANMSERFPRALVCC